MNARPVFLTGWRRLLVRLELHPAEAIALAAVLIYIIGALLLSVAARSMAGPVDCAPPDEDQVLVWYWSRDSPVCQYISRPKEI
jgi:hypothetical protein